MKDAERLTFRRVMPAPPARMFALWTELLLEHGPFPEPQIRAP